MLVKLVNGASVNPEALKFIEVLNKPVDGKKTWIVQAKLDDNTIHPIAFCSSQKEAEDCVKTCVEKINEAE